jgi:hypothetical protein
MVLLNLILYKAVIFVKQLQPRVYAAYGRAAMRNSCRVLRYAHRNQTINRKGAYILADVLAMDNSTVGDATRLFCGFSLK